MTKRFFICAGVCGALLVLLALTLIVQYDLRQPSGYTAQSLQLVKTVRDLDECLTCHAAPAGAETVRRAAHTQIVFALTHNPMPASTDVFAHTTSDSEQLVLVPELGMKLRDIGHRLLDLPVAQAQQATGLIDGYLAVYDVALAADTTSNTSDLLAALVDIEQALRTLEHQAHAEHLAAHHAPEAQPALALMASVHGPSPLVAWTVIPAVSQITRVQAVLGSDGVVDVMPALAYAVLRRGPPEAHMACDPNIVAGRRLFVAM